MFVFDEGSIEIPKQWKDETINVLSASSDGSLGFTLVINRDELPWGMTFPEYVEQEVSKIGETLTDYKEVMKKEYTLEENPAYIIEYKWRSEQGPIHQFVVMTVIKKKVLIFTASAPKKMSDNQKQQFQKIVQSFKISTHTDQAGK